MNYICNTHHKSSRPRASQPSSTATTRLGRVYHTILSSSAQTSINTNRSCLRTHHHPTRPREPMLRDHLLAHVSCPPSHVPDHESNVQQPLDPATTPSPPTLRAAMAADQRRSSSFTSPQGRNTTRITRLRRRTKATTPSSYTGLPVATMVVMAGRDGYN